MCNILANIILLNISEKVCKKKIYLLIASFSIFNNKSPCNANGTLS